jgi:hypothetical protein
VGLRLERCYDFEEFRIAREENMSEENMNSSSLPSDPSVQDLIGLYDSIGVPHFQRGLVWSEENTALLLESLYLNTPCGTIILWEPKEPEKEGIPLSNPQSLKYLVIDGQQRIRSLRDALKSESETPALEPPEDEGGDSGEIEPNARRVWCLNLSRVPELTEFFDTGMWRYPMFCLIADPTREAARVKHNLVPLRLFFEGRDADVSKLIRSNSAPPEKVLRRMEDIRLGNDIRSLWKKKVFFLKILQESQKEHRLEDMVGLYNRINSAGKRVESEEKAFATLVSLHPSTSPWLKGLFEAVHPGAPAGDLERDNFLKRRKERNFGFKLFIRTFIQVCAYRFGFSLGSNSFSFEVVNSLPFRNGLKKNDVETQRLFERTSEVVRFARGLLGDGLKCDDLQTLPDTTSLLPFFQVLIRFPQLMTEPRYGKVLQCLALRLLLSPNLNQDKILDCVKQVNEAKTAKDCLEKLDGKVDGPTELGKKLGKRLEDANTLLDRYVLMLYWLLRKRGARDFSYENLIEKNRARLQPGKEVALEEGVKPEKQHIVPFSLLEKLYNIEKRGRVSRNLVNNIGNITFISHDLNGFEVGLGCEEIDLGLDTDDNLECHFLGTVEVRKAYKNAIQMATNADATAQKAFEDFCNRRRELIKEAFVKWVEELGPLTIAERVGPEERVAPSFQDRVRRLHYPAEIEDAVLELAREPLRLTLVRRKTVAERELFCKVKSPSDQKGFIIRFLEDQFEVEPATGSSLYEMLEKLRPASSSQDEHVGKWVLPAGQEDSANTSRILKEFRSAAITR